MPAFETLPGWLVAGIGLGGLLSGLVIVAFVVGLHRFPDRRPRDGTGDNGERRRRTEIRAYLRSIGEPFEEDRPVADRHVAFYLPERGVAITFDPKQYFRLERAGVRAVLIEHELPGVSLGSRLPFETPPLDAVEPPVVRAFARLGLSSAADTASIRAAYRERVKAAHPDHGGDRASFRRLREAYTVARDHADRPEAGGADRSRQDFIRTGR